jgi:hypothetical protein
MAFYILLPYRYHSPAKANNANMAFRTAAVQVAEQKLARVIAKAERASFLRFFRLYTFNCNIYCSI